jgi:hypothetical protein
MAKRRTIGDNPLDSFSKPPASASQSLPPDAVDVTQGAGRDQVERSKRRAPGSAASGHGDESAKAESVSTSTTQQKSPAGLPVQVEAPPIDTGDDNDRLRYAGTSWRGWWDRAIHADIRVVGGSFPLGLAHLARQGLSTERRLEFPGGKSISLRTDVARLTVVARRPDRRVGRLLLWGAAGAFIGGPVGAAAAGLFGGRERQVVSFEIQLTDHRLIQAEAHPATLRAIEEEMA